VQVTFVGAGYVGLTSAAIFADLGHKVWVLDVDERKIRTIRSGKEPFYEPGLGERIKRTVESARLIPSTSYKEAIPEAVATFICVGTPSKENGETNLSYVFSAAGEIGKNLGEHYTVVVVKSTVPPGTTDRVGEMIEKLGKRRGIDFDVVNSPEFLAEGSAVKDTVNPSRIVLGVDSEKPIPVLRELFKSFKDVPTLICDIKSAELIKYASNSFLATKVSFINEISLIAEKFGADVTRVAEGMGLDDRIGSKFLKAGLGYGGSCFPKDVASLLFVSNHAGYDFGILQAATKVNCEQRKRFVGKIKEKLEDLKDKKIAILGLAFKPESGDMRKAVSAEIIRSLLNEGAQVSVYDPAAMENAKKEDFAEDIEFSNDAYAALKGADCLALVTEWKEFAELDWKKVRRLMRGNLIADGRNFYDPVDLRESGFEYVGIGRN